MTIILKRGMVVLCTECKHSVTQSWNTTKVYWQFRGIMLTWKYEPWKIYISVSFTFSSVVGKPTSDSRHDLDDMVQSILERWQAEGIMILLEKGSGDIWEVRKPMTVKGITGKKRSLIRGCGGQIRIIIYWLKQWMWIVVSMTDV